MIMSFKEKLIDAIRYLEREHEARQLCLDIGIPERIVAIMTFEEVCEVLSENYVMLYKDIDRGEIGLVRNEDYVAVSDKIKVLSKE